MDESKYERRYYKSAPIVYLWGSNANAFPREENGFVNYVALVVIFEKNNILYTLRIKDEHTFLVHIPAPDLPALYVAVAEKFGIKPNSASIKPLGNVKLDGQNKLVDYSINYDYYYYFLSDAERDDVCARFPIDDVITHMGDVVIVPALFTGKAGAVAASGCVMRNNSEILTVKALSLYGYKCDSVIMPKFKYRGLPSDIKYFF
jgi:hypothetical protein